MSTALTSEELLAFAGLVRWLVRLDGQFSEDEEAAIEEVAVDLFSGGATEGPYRGAAETANAAAPEAIWDLIERAGELLPDEEALRRLARGVTRQEARERIYGALYVVASSDVISKQEWPFLEWLEKEWGVG